jgi:hypothetical protein
VGTEPRCRDHPYPAPSSRSPPPPPEPTLSDPLDRRDALRVLQLSPAADAETIKRAYRRLVRDHHPDVGGDADTFHALQRAYEVLLDREGPPPPPPGRPSRDRDAWSSAQAGPARPAADPGTVDWSVPLLAPPARLDRADVARWLAADGDPVVRPLTATSRAPGSRLNGAARRLSSDLTSAIDVRADVDDRGRPVVVATVSAESRRGRRALDAAALDGGWVRRRSSTSTRLRWTAAPDADRQVTAVRAAGVLAELLARAGWPLSDWTLTGT